ncbi:hypothetical protein [Streptomyces sp. NBC_00347]|uniref:hypothetical protein n=1 Tax=Streptomyces sp. NBC_00347 TaxID=2975721 RepID=UPI00225381E7|nr:hypothetical protein [Streptomyces sp. NBC_00347]MCX5129429.1 hypothetical protein [Streptomyces sp. NBC_00347]
MVTPVEDLPEGLGEVFSGGDEDKHLFRSALRIYLLMLDLTEPARRHGGADYAACFPYSREGSVNWGHGCGRTLLVKWGLGHGFEPERKEAPDSSGGAGRTSAPVDGEAAPALVVNVNRLRRAALERGGKPVAHSRETFHDYMRTSRAAAERSRAVVREALETEVVKARAVQAVPVLTSAFLQRAEEDPERAAGDVGLDADGLERLLSGEQDVVLVACTEPESSPFTGPGRPCGASFLDDCLRCENARALPRQLPVQVHTHDRLKALKTDLDARLWNHLHAETFARLTHLLTSYTTAERSDARMRLTMAERELVDDLMNGRLDLR